LALSVWKKAGESRWSLRVNPSSGDLHPTEAHFITGPVKDLCDVAAVFHYSAYEHALERRAVLTKKEWGAIAQNLPADPLLVALSSIFWRESWKYGERAYRYCHHDIGHAIGTVAFAAVALGWQTRLFYSILDDDLARLLGLQPQKDIEAEHPDCILVVSPVGDKQTITAAALDLSSSQLERLKTIEFEGSPNTLSSHHHEWPIIDLVVEACRLKSRLSLGVTQEPVTESHNEYDLGEDRHVSAREIIRESRSALAMDGHTSISKDTFYRMMAHVTPHLGKNIVLVLPWSARISLGLFIHRVECLSPGLCALVRRPSHEKSLRNELSTEFCWEKPQDCPQSLPLYLLCAADGRDAARVVCCHQHIAANGAFALGMLAEFNAALKQHGAPFYPRLFWETGLIGQILYLEAEAAGIRSTGIGCFFDDAMQEMFGIRDHAWQSLYHFTVGGALDDLRLQTLPAYWHLQ
jgi:SagB-type dehydrogenase family enzyme